MLIDYLMLEGKDPFVIDANVPEGPLRAAFPGRTALVDFDQIPGQMKLFDTIMGSIGRDYVVDIPASQTEKFFTAIKELDVLQEATRRGFQFAILFIVDKELASYDNAEDLRVALAPHAVIYVRNNYVGSFAPPSSRELTIDIPPLDRDIFPYIEDRYFSYRAFLLGDEAAIPLKLVNKLKAFLLAMVTGLQDIEPELSLRRLRNL